MNVYGLMHYNGDTLEYFSEIDGLDAGRITGVVEDREGRFWFGGWSVDSFATMENHFSALQRTDPGSDA